MTSTLTKRRFVSRMAGLAAGLLMAAGVSPALAQPAGAQEAGAQEGWTALRQPGTHVLMRHAIAPGIGDPEGFRLGDCSTQRNLDDAGRAQARAAGDALRANGIAVDLVLTSQWCRAAETAALLGFSPVEEEPSLNSFFDDRANAEAATTAAAARLKALGSGTKAVLVTHQVNINALTEASPASGEMIVIALGANGEIEVRGRIRTGVD